ncbi:MAG: DUF1577 domain-containing protein [Spirochaetes bacterium]|nr:DUF1577 domain-containing protein [Spirochaetota bacterium]
MIQVNQRKNRDFQEFETLEDVINILKSQFASRKLYIKYAIDKTEVNINEYLPDGTMMLVTDPNYKNEGGGIIIYGLSDKYIEIDLDVVEERGPGYYHCKVNSARRALRGRRDLRFKVAPDDVVATNFRISRHTIDVSSFSIPTSIKVVLEQFQSQNSKMSDVVRVDVFKPDDRDRLLVQLKKTGQTLWIANTSEQESYKAMNDDFVDMGELYGDDLAAVMKRYIERGYKSILAVPIIYITESSSTVPFAYIQLISKGRNFTLDDVLLLKDHSFKLIDRIRDANTHLIPLHQRVIDISRGGAKLKITDKNLQKYIMRSKGFIFDLVFKLQAPITIFGEVKVSVIDEEGNLLVGVDFGGNSSRKDEMKRYYSILKPMETDYKAKLIKSMRDRKKETQPNPPTQ